MLSLTVLGAGPKAIAVQAKAHALRRMGLPAPEILVIDPQGVGGNWLSGGGWTNGHHLLGTSPMKDVGFPYRTRIVDPPDAHGTRPLNQEVDRSCSRSAGPSSSSTPVATPHGSTAAIRRRATGNGRPTSPGWLNAPI